MQRELNLMRVLAKAHHPGAEQRGAFHPERRADIGRGDPQRLLRRDVGRQHAEIRQRQLDRHWRMNDLLDDAIDQVERRPQRFVPLHQRVETLLQRCEVERAVPMQDHRLVVQRQLGRELGVHPDMALFGRQRHGRAGSARRASRRSRCPRPCSPPDARRGQLEAWWGQLFEEEKKLAEAESCYRLAVRHAPEVEAGFVRLAYLLRRDANATDRKENRASADRAIAELVAKNPASPESYLARWRYRRDFDLLAIRESGDRGQVPLEEAAEDVTQAIKRKPDAVGVLLAAADLERLRSREAADDPARTPAQREAGLKSHRDKAFAFLDQGLKLVKQKKAGPLDDSGEFHLLWHKANLLLDDLDQAPGKGDAPPAGLASRAAEVEALADQVRKLGITGTAEYIRGRLALHRRRWAAAAGLFEQARSSLSRQPDLAAQANLYLGQCYQRLEEPTQMYNAFKRVSDWNPSSSAARMGMAAARLAQGQLKEASEQFAVLKRLGQVPPRAWIEMARLEMQRQMQSDKPDWRDALAALDQARKADPKAATEVVLLRAELLFRQGKADEAKDAIESARDAKPDDADLWTALAGLAARRDDKAGAARILDEAQAKLGDRVSLRLARARLGSKEDQAANRGKLGAADQARLLGGLADIALRAGDDAKARKLWTELATLPRYKSDLRLHLLLFDLAVKAQDEPGMQEVLASIAGIEQASGTYQRYGRALMAIWRFKKAKTGEERKQELETARLELARVQAARPSWPALWLARGEVAELAGRPEDAIRDYDEAIKNGEQSPGVIRRQIALLSKKGRHKQAEQLLGRLSRSVLASSDLQRLAAQVAIRGGDLEKALKIAQASIREETADPAELVFVARVLSANRRYDDAEAKLDRAIKIAPAEPEPWLARVQFLVERKRKEDVEAALAAAQEKIDPKRRALALAQCCDVAGLGDKARVWYGKALAEAKDDPAVMRAAAAAHLASGRAALAEPLLRRLAEGGAIPASDQDWARRALAVSLASSTDYKRFAEALALVGLKLDAKGKLPAVDDRGLPTGLARAQARVLASQGQRQFRIQAIALLESLERKGGMEPDDKFVLAALYEAEGETRRSQEKLRSLARTPLRTPRYLAQYAMSLIAQKRELAEAERIAGMLEELEKQREAGPNAFASVDIRSRILEARGQKDAALALMKAHVERKGAAPTEVLLLVGTLGRQRRYKEAYALCEKAWKEGKCPPEAVASAATSLLRVMEPTDAQVAKVEKRLAKAIEDKPASTVLRLQLADLLDRRGQYPQAAKLYREVLAKEPNNFVALNNLAWMLAHGGGDAKEALGHIEKAVAGMGRRPDLLDTRGMIHLALKETGKAVADLKEASAEGTTPGRLFHLARAYDAGRDKASARAALKQAKEAGLSVARLHPVEQATAKKMLADYGM